jgi:FdhD protein
MRSDDKSHPAILVSHGCHVLGPEGLSEAQRDLICEEPIVIAIGPRPATTLMCTPGDEVHLALGYLYTEGIIASAAEVGAIAFCRDAKEGRVVRVHPADRADWESRLSAHRTVFSSCSICGAEAINGLTSCIKRFDRPAGRLTQRAIRELAELMHKGQRFFTRTGGTHAAALAQVRDGRLASETLIVKEDIGRHNAMDKAIGQALRARLNLRECLLMLSGRLSFEMISKAARAGISDVAGVSAPTALAVEVARRLNMFLAGFVRGETATVYTGAAAIAAPET